MKMTTFNLQKRDSAAGRPKDMQKQRAILDAAREHFLQHGYVRASMDAIASDAGVSKLTIYSHFNSKQELFARAIAEECSHSCIEDDCTELANRPVKEALTFIANRFIALVFRPQAINMHRVLIADACTQPEISQLFYEAGPQTIKESFSAYLTKLNERGALNIAEPERATNHFFCLLKGDYHCRALLNMDERLPDDTALAAHIDDVVALFIRAYQP